MPSERAIEENVCAWLKLQGWGTMKAGNEGYPDRLVLLGNGNHIWMEFKTPEGKLRAQQVNRIYNLQLMGEVVFVVTSLESAQDAIATLRVPTPLSTYGDSKNHKS